MSNTENNYTETDLGNISLNPRGEYNSSTAYEYLDAVSYQGGSYFCLTELETTITGIAPDPGHNSEHWQMLALPGNMTPEYIAMHDDVINKAKQVETSRAAVELSQQEIESAQADVQQLHSDTVQAAQEAENSRDSAAGYAQSAEQSRKSASESEQNINAQITGFDDKVTESVNQAKEEIDSTRQQAINAITSQQDTSVNTIKTEGEKIITKVEKDAKTVADDRAAVEAAAQTVADNAQEVAQNTQNVASNTENAAASAESAKTFADNAAQSAKSVEDASKQIEQNKKDVTSLKEDITSKADKTALAQTDRKLNALWKLNQGISYEFQTDDTEAYQKTVLSGAKMASVKSIGGKTIVWNQLLKDFDHEKEQICGNANTYITFTKTFENDYIPFAGHKYYTSFECFTERTDSEFGIGIGEYCGCGKLNNISNTWTKITRIVSPNQNKNYKNNFYIFANAVPTTFQIGESIKIRNVNIFDLTQMFGSGNEPSTVEEFEAMFPADYYPYNASELMSAPVNEVVEQGKNLYYGTEMLAVGSDSHEYFTEGYYSKNIQLKPNTTYTISFISQNASENIILLINLSRTVNSNGYLDFRKQNDSKTYTTSNDGLLHIGVVNITKSEVIKRLEECKIQIEESSTATIYSPYYQTSYPIPQAILNLDGYGWGIDDVCNYVDWENKKYHKRVSRYVVTGDEQFYSSSTYIGDNSSNAYMSMDIGQKRSVDAKLISNKLLYSKWCWSTDRTYDAMCLNSTQIHIRIQNSSLGITNEASPVEVQNAVKKYCKNLYESGDPIIIYYELAEEEITDISDIIGTTFQEPLEVEAGGTLTFKNSHGDDYRIPVPSTEEYLVSLAEVAK